MHALSSPSSLSPGRPKGSWKHRRAAAPTGPAVKAGLVLTVPGREGTGPCSSEPRCHRELRCRTTSPVVGQQSTSETPAVNCFNGTRACQGKRFLAPFPFLTQKTPRTTRTGPGKLVCCHSSPAKTPSGREKTHNHRYTAAPLPGALTVLLRSTSNPCHKGSAGLGERDSGFHSVPSWSYFISPVGI